MTGNHGFTFIGTAEFSGKACELRYFGDWAGTWVQGDVNGDGTSDLNILLRGSYTLVATDFGL